MISPILARICRKSLTKYFNKVVMVACHEEEAKRLVREKDERVLKK